MKRKCADIYPKIKVVNPLFWKPCRVCRYEYKREKMYKISDIFFDGTMKAQCGHIFICNHCASSKEDALKIYNSKGVE